MNIKHFQYIRAVAECPTLSAAAEKLFISQPALSQQIRKIEDELGAELFSRDGHSMTLTPQGEIFLRGGTRIIQIYDSLRQEIQLSKAIEVSAVRFGISPFYSQHYLPKLLPKFLAEYPQIKIDITEEISVNLERKLINGELDFCVLPLYPQNEALEYETIYAEEILLAIPQNHPLNQYYPLDGQSDGSFPLIDLSFLKNEPFIGLKKVQKFSHIGRRICEEAGFTPNTVCETLNWETVHMLIATGLGGGFVPRILVGSITDPKLAPRYYQLPTDSHRAYTVAKRPEALLSRSALILIESIRESFRLM